ncbi:transcriptional initiation protein Tat [Halogeometricum limi]|uniref:Uncharacterized protein n=1 Tax=Halogeometricum limi TaxID=555875 RepID=A0A1I6HWE4_9EURY|nr:transcriptional initiation protein Tat [Halogeometricum limi]SFR58765.1 hypothetical protein SAMN04488124_2537 [Halogeometricum limi]
MVPQPSLTRRTLLGGVGAALGASLVGTGLFAPTWLPDAVTDELLRYYPEPADNYLWRPPVSESHADAAVERLAETVEAANRLAERVDEESLSDDQSYYFRIGRDPSGGWLGSARDASDPRERLFNATYGMQFAGEALGYLKLHFDELDAEDVVERGDRLRTAAADVHDSVRDYRVSDPRRDLAYLYSVEKYLGLVRLDSHRGGVFLGGTADAEEYDERDVAGTVGSHLQAEQRLADARHYRDQYRENLGDDARPYADQLDGALSRLTAMANDYPRRHDLQERLREEDVDQSTPLGAARWELFTLGYDDDFRFGFDDDGYRPNHRVQHVVETAWAVLARRAHEFALDELDVSPGDTGYDSGRTLKAKRRAMRTFRSVREAYDSPFAGVLAQEAASRIRAGDIGLGSRWDAAADDRPAWQDRVESTTYYLMGNGTMRELGDVLGVILAR